MIRKRSVAVWAATGAATGLVILLIGIILGLFWPMVQVQAGPLLPPRNNPPTTTQPDDSQKDDDDDTLIGAHIELHVQPNQTNLWAVVQWQDNTGNWHNVDGWQGTLEAGGRRRWWVDQKDFGTGLFRWVVTQGPGGPVLGTSKPFSLPATAGEVIQVVVSLR